MIRIRSHHHHHHQMMMTMIQQRTRQYPSMLLGLANSTSTSSSTSSSCFLSTWTANIDTGIVSSPKTITTTTFQTIIGLEIHAQLDISTKLFSNSQVPKSSIIQLPNSNPDIVQAFDVAIPGILPQLSKSAVHAAILTAAATQCDIQTQSRFERKHYFYADSPLGYQITQQRWPIATNGKLLYHPKNNNNNKVSSKKQKKKKKSNKNSNDWKKAVRIERIQLEQDTGKTIVSTTRHKSDDDDDDDGTTTRKIVKEESSLVDFNRAGCALVEIVFQPDLRSANDAATVVETLRNLLKHIGTCNGRMEEGSLRCDLNVSIAPIIINDNDNNNDDNENDDDIVQRSGHRVEVKNLSSLRNIVWAAIYEAERQAQAVMDGTPIPPQTRTFDLKSRRTVVLRTKEGAEDYRFMPEPDLPPIILNSEVFDGLELSEFLQENLPELPEEARQRLMDDYELSEYLATVLTGDPPSIQMLDEAIQVAKDQLIVTSKEDNTNKIIKLKDIAETVANFLCNELFALIRESELELKHFSGPTTSTSEATIKDDENDDTSSSSFSSAQYSRVTGTQLGELVALVLNGVISNNMAKQILPILFRDEMEYGKSPSQVAQERGYQLIVDPKELAILCQTVIDEHPEEMERYQMGGKFARKITKFLLGKAMAKSGGNAQPERLNEVLEDVLDEVAPNVSRN